MINSYADLEPYLKDFQWLEHKKDQPSLFITGAEFQAHFLYFAGHTPEKRQALAECVEAFNQHYAENFTWGAYVNENEKMRYYDIAEMPSIKEAITKNSQPDDQIEWSCSSGERDEAPEYNISAFTNRNWEGRNQICSTLTFHVPNELIFNAEQKQILMSLIQTCIDKLGVYHAVAGFQGVLPYRPIGVGDYSLAQGERFWGIYQGADIKERSHISDGIKSIDWLTYLSNTLVQRICEVKTFPKYCQHFNVKPQQQNEGFLFQLEDYPQLLPSNQPILKSYYNLNKALRPLRNGAYRSISWDVGNNYKVLDVEASRKWIRRLDAPDIFPDHGHYQERKPQKNNIYLETGRPCEVNGVYRYEDQLNFKGEPRHAGYDNRDDYEQNYVYDLRQQVVLLQGDIAPRYLDFYENAVLKEAKKVKWRLVSEIIRVAP